MLKKTITYNDYNGMERTESFYFDINPAEMTEWEMGIDGGLTMMINKIIETKNMPELVKIFKKLVLFAYGEKSSDGRRFVKSTELSTAFSQTPAYSKIFMELATNSNKAAEFVNGVMPKPEDIPSISD